MAPRAIKVELKGLAQLRAGSEGLGRNIADGAGRAFLDLAQVAQAATAARVPHRSGRLAASATAIYDSSRHTASVGIGQGIPYSGWIEFGGGRYKGRKFRKRGRYLYPTARRTARELQPAGEKVATQKIRSQHWQSPK